MKRRAAMRVKSRNIKVIVEKHPDTYIAYPLGVKGSCVGQGDSYEEALTCVKAMLNSHIAALGNDAFEDDSPVQEVFVAETKVGA